MIFVKRDESDQEMYNVGVTLNNRNIVPGLVGIEIEVEGKKIPKEPPPPWTFHVDHSLRGAENGEYVLAAPIPFEEVDKSVDGLWDLFRKKGTTLDESNRTSVHVHLNVQSFHLNRLTSLMGLYFTLEEALTEWCGDHRVGNLFCVRAKDAPAIISQIRRFIKTGMQFQLRDNHHYAALNSNALHKFGSLEFRTLRGVSDPGIIKEWVSILKRLYDLSASFQDPREICYAFSADGPSNFFDNILGEKANVVRNGIGFSETRIQDSMYTGIRMAQDLCFSRDWGKFKGVEYKPDPFGRSPRKKRTAIIDVEAALNEIYDEDEPDEEVNPGWGNAPQPVHPAAFQQHAIQTLTTGQTVTVNTQDGAVWVGNVGDVS